MKPAGALIRDLSSAARHITLAPGEVLVQQGDEADEVFINVSASLVASTETPQGEVDVGTIGPGQIVGEVTVIAGGRRTATLRTAEAGDVLALSRADFEAWLHQHPDWADAVSAQARERVDRSQVAAMVTDVLDTSEPTLIQEVVDRVEWHRLEAGEVLFEQGDVASAAYFVVGGRLAVSIRSPAGKEEKVRELGRGEVVGELGLLDRAPRAATVRAVRDSTLAAFSTEVFEELLSRHPKLMLHVARGILTRLRVPSHRTVDRATSVAVAVAAPDDVSELLDDVVEELRKHGSVRHLSSTRIDRLLNRPDISQAAADNVGVPRLSEFLHEADVGNEHVLLETDREPTAWTRRALRQADRVVIVASPNPDREEQDRIQKFLDAVGGLDHVATMLATLHPASTRRPRRTAETMDRFGFDEVVHLRAGSTADAGRLARLAGGHGVGLVLSGGGARGFAHIGVFRALVEAGVPVDRVGGCSMGAPIAGGIALGTPADQGTAQAQRQFHRLLDYTLPVVSLIKGERITRNIEDTFGTWDFEDLWLPFYCVSTNLTKSRLEVHDRGDITRAIRASVAIPGILPPVPHEGDLLVDGGVMNNLPFEPMHENGTIGSVIAVNVAPEQGPPAPADFGLSVSGFRALAAALSRKSASYPSAPSVLLRSMLTGAVHNLNTSLTDSDAVDLLLSLDLAGVSLLDFERVQEVADRGYEASIDVVGEWAVTQGWANR